MEEEGDNPVASVVEFAATSNVGETDTPVGPFPMVEEVLQCQLSQWYPTFSKLHGVKRANVTIGSVLVDVLSPDFRDYLLSDGVRLPVDATKLSSYAPKEQDGDDEWSSDEEENDNVSDCSQPPQQFHFPQLNQQIVKAIDSLGGAVVPKLNWSSPKDAAWVNGGTIKCKTPGDIYLLIKSSDFCLHDVLLQALKDCQDYDEPSFHPPQLQLSLRKWCTLHPSMEFRCFVRQHELLAISQRNHTQHYPHLMQDWPQFRDLLMDFFEDTIRNCFADGNVANYVVDLYLDKKDRVSLYLDYTCTSLSGTSNTVTLLVITDLDIGLQPMVTVH